MSTNSLAAADHVAVYAISQKQKRQVIGTLGFEVFELQPTPTDFAKFVPRHHILTAHYDQSAEDLGDLAPTVEGRPRLGIHAKTTVIDRQIAIVGSHNFDPRSKNLNTESILIINDAAVAGAIEDDILRDTEPQNSWVVGPRISSPVVSFLVFLPDRVLSTLPLFDVWPLRETNSFALNEGKQPVSISDERFRSHYADVGQFPEVEEPSGNALARLSFGIWIRETVAGGGQGIFVRTVSASNGTAKLGALEPGTYEVELFSYTGWLMRGIGIGGQSTGEIRGLTVRADGSVEPARLTFRR